MSGKKGVLVFAAVAGLLAGAAAGCSSTDTAKPAQSSCKANGTCKGGGSCKGEGSCKGQSSCKSQSSCGKNSCG